ncbi:uncharacterized protein LOC6606420 [Drosophila sechellia]|uniref:uncharacterized protein LOC6606420 n=1 Tax=Drosophila sechellia TaxID=7238 RepID=UPI0013DDD848|nr:uncharacterized protein LOC6606420 [Drosophila sechellia]
MQTRLVNQTRMSITLFTLLVLCAGATLGLIVPQHYCDEHFRYAMKNEEQIYIGIFSAPNAALKVNSVLNWRATFEMEGKRDLFVGPMNTYPNKTEAATNIVRGMPAEVFVEFLNITTALPKLTSLYINDRQVCSSEKYPFPKTRITLTHQMTFRVKNKAKNSLYI